MKVSFDFDHTLAEKNIQKLANIFIEKGHDVYITTSRFMLSPFYSNEKVYDVADLLNIPHNKIRFTNGEDKYVFLEDFDIHFDDDITEIELINDNTNCVGILVDEK